MLSRQKARSRSASSSRTAGISNTALFDPNSVLFKACDEIKMHPFFFEFKRLASEAVGAL
jgi:hypothetical protein